MASHQDICGGGERTRTADFYVANVALYQLSYTPEGGASVPKGPDLPARRNAASSVVRRSLRRLDRGLEPGRDHRRRQVAAGAFENRA